MNRTTLKAAGDALWGPQYRSEMARQLSVSLRTAMRLDSGERPVPDATLRRLAELLVLRKWEIDKMLDQLVTQLPLLAGIVRLPS
jgi:hypothetical protein